MKMRNLLVAGLVGLVALVGLPGHAGAVTSDAGVIVDSEVTDVAALGGPFYLQFRHSAKCAEVPGASRTEGVGLDQWTCVAQANVWWYLDYVFTYGGFRYVRIRNAHSGLCMNISGGSLANGARVIQYRCGAYANEYFRFVRNAYVPSGYAWVQSYSSGKVLNIAGGSPDNGADLIQYTGGYYNNEYVKIAVG